MEHKSWSTGKEPSNEFSAEQKLSIIEATFASDSKLLFDLPFDLRHLNFLAEGKQEQLVSPLMAAAIVGDLYFTQFYVELPSTDIDFTDLSGKTALSHAVLNRNYQVAKLLLDRKAEPNVPDCERKTPLVHCILTLLAESTLFQNRKMCLKLGELLLKHGADPNWYMDVASQTTILHFLCKVPIGSEAEVDIMCEVFELLVRFGAQLRLSDREGSTPQQLIKNPELSRRLRVMQQRSVRKKGKESKEATRINQF